MLQMPLMFMKNLIIGMYQVPSTNAETLVATAKLALNDLNIPITKLRGQWYDGTAAMRGIRSK